MSSTEETKPKLEEQPEMSAEVEPSPPPETSAESPVETEPVPVEAKADDPTPPAQDDPAPTGKTETVAKTTKETKPKKAATKKATTAKKAATKKKPAAKKPAAKKKVAKKKPVKKPAGAVWKLKLSQIVLPDNWNRQSLGDISDLVASFQELGKQLLPVRVRLTDSQTKFELIDGRRRFAAAQEVGWSSIECVLDSGAKSDKDTELQALAANLVRKDNTPYELALGFERMGVEHDYTNERIAAACGRTPGFVSQHRAVWRAPKKLQTAFEQGKVRVSLFRHVSRLNAEEDAKFLDKIVERALKGTEAAKIGEQISTYLQKKEEKAGKKGKTKSKKGGAAHRRKGPQLDIRDYSTQEVYQAVNMAKKKDAISALKDAADRLRSATTKDRKSYYQGVIDGMEELTGLVDS